MINLVLVFRVHIGIIMSSYSYLLLLFVAICLELAIMFAKDIFLSPPVLMYRLLSVGAS